MQQSKQSLDDVEIFLNRKFNGTILDPKKLKDRNRAPTGEIFETICSGGPRIGDESVPVLCSGPELAVDLFAKAVIEYSTARTKDGDGPFRLYWRETPEVRAVQITEQEFGRVTHRIVAPRFYCEARLLITAAPELPVD